MLDFVHFAPCILFSGAVDTFLHSSRLSLPNAFDLLRLFEGRLICLDILRNDEHFANDHEAASHTNRRCLIFSFCSLMRFILSASSSSLSLS